MKIDENLWCRVGVCAFRRAGTREIWNGKSEIGHLRKLKIKENLRKLKVAEAKIDENQRKSMKIYGAELEFQ